jgi:phospholipase C
VEKRFNLPSLTARDAAQADMEEFFDFSSPNLNPPSPASQPLNLPCNPESGFRNQECVVSAAGAVSIR